MHFGIFHDVDFMVCFLRVECLLDFCPLHNYTYQYIESVRICLGAGDNLQIRVGQLLDCNLLHTGGSQVGKDAILLRMKSRV